MSSLYGQKVEIDDAIESVLFSTASDEQRRDIFGMGLMFVGELRISAFLATYKRISAPVHLISNLEKIWNGYLGKLTESSSEPLKKRYLRFQ
jgi:hypothetical protein